MIRLSSLRAAPKEPEAKPMGFDDFQVSLGDMMRGERATLGKSLMDVQRELKIKAAYIAAVEDADPSVFDTPGFISGYVRSYAKYLGIDSDLAFEKFCAESGFAPSHGMSEKALPQRVSRNDGLAGAGLGLGASTGFLPEKESFLAQIDIRALASSLVLICLVGGLGYGAYNVIQEVQQVRLVPIDQAPVVASDIDPLTPRIGAGEDSSNLLTPNVDAFERLYRPQPLDTPILVHRDGPIARLNPDEQGAFTSPQSAEPLTLAAPIEVAVNDVQVLEAGPETITLVATDGVWLRVRDADGTILVERIMDAGNRFSLPVTAQAPILERAGNSGALYVDLGGELWGPIGKAGGLSKNVILSPEAVRDTYAIYTPSEQHSLFTYFDDIEAGDVNQ